eukprot:1161537-Pelagomonas_calceolata.AAC.3
MSLHPHGSGAVNEGAPVTCVHLSKLGGHPHLSVCVHVRLIHPGHEKHMRASPHSSVLQPYKLNMNNC